MAKRPNRELYQGPREDDDPTFILGQIWADLRNIRGTMERADESRKLIHEKLEGLTLRTAYIETDVHGLKSRLESIESVTDEVQTMRKRAQGAGMLGRWALRLGGWVLSAILGATAAWTALTGRPPPP